MSRLWLVRHGPTHAKAMIGWTDLPADLSDRAALDRLSSALPRAPVVSSDLRRARDTAEAIRRDRPLLPPDPQLREIHFGDWEGLTHGEAEARDREALFAFWDAPGSASAPNGESWDRFAARTDAAIDRLRAEHDEIVVVCHFGVILRQLQRARGLGPREGFAQTCAPLSLSRIDRGRVVFADRAP